MTTTQSEPKADLEAARATRPAISVVFRCRGEDLFGMLHPADTPTAGGLGVVLCNPLGYEAMCAHRCYRHLADRLAARGLPAFRFDYPGTGDSAGCDVDPDRLEAWCHGVRAAIDTLRELAGVKTVALFGMRFGAAIAVRVGAERRDVSALALWAPCVSGRAYVRELRAFRLIKERQSRVAPLYRPGGDEEVAGFLFAAETIAALSSVDLLRSVVRPSANALIVPRDDLPGGEDRLAGHLASLGAEVVVSDVAGYGAMMRDPQESVVPSTALDTIADWLAVRAFLEPPADAAAACPTARLAAAGRSGRRIVEEPIRFGDADRLFGILTGPEPRSRKPSTDSPPLIFLNVGANHHVGPNRMYVSMARDLAAMGHSVFRFDVAGLGESLTAPGARENRLYSKDSVGDVKEAMNLLERELGARKFVLLGLCSGAYLAFHTAIEDARVTGQVLLNPQTFEWKEGDSLELSVRRSFLSTRYYARSLVQPGVWVRVLRGDVNVRGIAGVLRQRFTARATAGLGAILAQARGREAPRSEVEQAFVTMSDRGAQTLLVFSSNDGGLDMIEKHLGTGARRMRSRKNFRLEIVEGADHTFTPMASRERLYEIVTAFVTERFSPRAQHPT